MSVTFPRGHKVIFLLDIPGRNHKKRCRVKQVCEVGSIAPYMADDATVMDIISTTLATLASTVAMDLATFQSTFLWAIIIGFILAFILGFGMGANDVSNAFGTSVGSRVLTIRKAYILATIMETLGAVLLGYNVADTIRKGVIDVSTYADQPEILMIGQIAILGGGSMWLLIATFAKLPVSTTHSIVGATLGFSLMARGTQGIHWFKIVEIIASWVISPLFSGIVACLIYLAVDFAVLRRKNPLECGYTLLPILFFLIFVFNAVAVLLDGSKVLGLEGLPTHTALGVSVGIGIVAALLAQFALKPWLRKWVEEKAAAANKASEAANNISVIVISKDGEKVSEAISTSTSVTQSSTDLDEISREQPFDWTVKGFFKWLVPHKHRIEDQKTLYMFSSLQVFTACFAGFAHGANDVSNAIAPITALISIYSDMNVQQTAPTPIYILFFGTTAVCIGLWCLGHRVIKTIGDRVTEVNPASGFVIEFGAAITAMIASKLGLPISTTHALVGSVVGVGIVKSGEGVDWVVFRNIAMSWFITLPASGIIAACIMFLLGFAI
uniref:Phosphate transporter n=1 Tax=Panagrellus redivivus TaxID=6233 RepID=A0A7E4V093_PANRE